MDKFTENKNISKQKESTYKSSFFFLTTFFLVIIVIDQITKYFASSVFKNSVFAFSLPLPVWLIYLIYIIVLGAMVFYVLKNHQNFYFYIKIAWALIFAGAVSNIAERILTGYVRDFIYIKFFNWIGIYNLADFFIIAGIILLLLPASILIQSQNDIKNF